MFYFKFIPKCFVVLTIMFKVISSQHCSCGHQRANNLGAVAPTPVNTEVLCKDLASAIQSVVISSMRSNPGLPPILRTPALGTPGCIQSTPGLSTNTINDKSNPSPCTMCARKWQNSLARVLGLTNSLEQKSAPVSSPSPVNVPLPYSGFVSFGGRGVQEFPAPTPPTNVNVPNVYPLPEVGPYNAAGAKTIGNNLAMLLSGSVPNGKMYPEIVMIGNNMPSNNLRNFS